MSKFINTTYQTTVQHLVDASNSKLNNPYYQYNDERPTELTYYNINQKESTIDNSTSYIYQDIGDNSGIKYNKINNLIVYGIPRIEVNLERGDYGVEADSIEGTMKILPNTIIPCPNDFFFINYLKDKLLFKVISSTPDTVNNDINFYKVEYKLDKLTNIDIEEQVVDEYQMLMENTGTNYNTIIRTEDYSTIQQIEELTDTLKVYYKNLFYKERVQTFILNLNGFYLYDAYLIEFINRSNLINTNEDYLYITQQISLPETFAIDYNKTFFNFIEKPKIEKLDKYYIYAQPKYVDDIFSILKTRQEDYFKVIYKPQSQMTIASEVLNIIDEDLIEKIKTNTYYTDINYMYRNIIIDYLYNKDLLKSSLDYIDNIEFVSTKELFYDIPILIYVLENYIKKLLALTSE